MPGHEVRVRLRTVEILEYTRGVYEFVFPLVVGERYVPGESLEPYPDAQTSHAQPDAHRIDPPKLPEGYRSGHDVSIEVVLDAGVPVATVRCPNHRMDSTRETPSRMNLRLAPDDSIPNRDFVLRWDVSSEQPAVGILTHRESVDGFFALLVQPKGEIDAFEAAPKEIILVLDTSGSMAGIPIEMSKRVVREALQTLGPQDAFNLVRFADGAEMFSSVSLPGEPASLHRALAWIEQLEGGGGTEMLRGFRKAFQLPPDRERMRVVVFLTDGRIGNDDEIVGAVREVVGQARIFTLGIGHSANHSLLGRMAKVGQGEFTFIPESANVEDVQAAVDRFSSWVTLPYLTDLEIDWGALPILDAIPEHPPDLFNGQTLSVVGRFVGAGEGEMTVRGRLGGAYWEQRVTVSLPHEEPANPSLRSVWARRRIEALMSSTDDAEEVREEVTRLGLEYRLMTKFTSFVAVDYSTVVNPLGASPQFRQPVEPPDTVAPENLVEMATICAKRDVVDLDATASSTTFGDEFIQDLPVQGRFHTNILTLAPGARERDFAAIVGGVGNVDPLTGLRLTNIDYDSIEEVEVIAAGAGVEFGRAQGGFANVIEKEGNNQVEGTVTVLGSTRRLDGDGPAGRDRESVDFGAMQPSFQIAGPILRDKLWYSFSHAYIRTDEPIDIIDDVAVSETRGSKHADRITWQVTSRNRLAFRFRSDSLQVDGVDLSHLVRPTSSSDMALDDRAYSLGWTVPYSPRLLVDSNLAYQDASFELSPSTAGSRNSCTQGLDTPLFTASCFDAVTHTLTGSAPRIHSDRLARLELATRITLFGGRFLGTAHQFKLGLGGLAEEYQRHVTRNPSLVRLSPSLLLARFSESPSSASSSATYWSVFLEDQVKPLSNLTVTVGGRVDGQKIAADGADRAPSIDDTSFSPFLGVSWDPGRVGKTKLGFSARRYHDVLPVAVPLVAADPATADVALEDIDGVLVPGGPPALGIQTVDANLVAPYQDELTLSFEQELAAETVIRLTYIRRDSHGQLQQIEIDHSPERCAPDPRCADVFVLGNFGSATYRAWVVQLVRRQYRNWQMHASYTFSEAEGDGEEFDPIEGDERTLLVDRPGWQSDDRRHVARILGTTIVPWLGGLRLGADVSWQSGLPYSILEYRVENPAIPRPRLVYVTGTRNDRRSPSYFDVSVKVAKEFNPALGFNLVLSVEIFNLMDDSTEVVYNDVPGYGRILHGTPDATRRAGRSTQLGATLTF